MMFWYVIAFCRAVIGIAFAISFFGKLRDLSGFEQTVARFNILPQQFARPASRLILLGELAVVVCIAAGGQLLIAGFAGAAILLLLFSAAMASVLRRRIDTSCNCFGASDKPVTPFDIWRNAGFILCALGGCGALSAPNGGQPHLALAEYGIAALGAAVFVAVSAQLGEIAQLFRSG